MTMPKHPGPSTLIPLHDRMILSRSRIEDLAERAAAAHDPGYGSGIVDILRYLLDPSYMPLHLAQTIAIRRPS